MLAAQQPATQDPPHAPVPEPSPRAPAILPLFVLGTVKTSHAVLPWFISAHWDGARAEHATSRSTCRAKSLFVRSIARIDKLIGRMCCTRCRRRGLQGLQVRDIHIDHVLLRRPCPSTSTLQPPQRLFLRPELVFIVPDGQDIANLRCQDRGCLHRCFVRFRDELRNGIDDSVVQARFSEVVGPRFVACLLRHVVFGSREDFRGSIPIGIGIGAVAWVRAFRVGVSSTAP